MSVATYYDLRFRIIPNRLLLIGTIGTIVIWLFWGNLQWWECLFSALVIGGVPFLVSYFSDGGIGGGDIKLMAWLGLSTGFIFAASVLLTGVILGFIYGRVHRKIFKEKSFPLGHCFLIAALITIIN
ncbi:prepilin peptidase [Paenibacillus melissococcoides]